MSETNERKRPSVADGVVKKPELYESFRRILDGASSGDDPDAPYRHVYWSPSGGTTATAPGRDAASPRHVPVDAGENDLQRSAVAVALLAGGVYGPRTIDANLFDAGRGGYLYRAREIFQDFVAKCRGTSLPLGWNCPDDAVVKRCIEFRANSISASPSRMAQLAGHVLAELRRLESETGGGGGGDDKSLSDENSGGSPSDLDALNAFRLRITRGVFACEPMHDARSDLIGEAFPNLRMASILGGAEVGCWGVSLPCMAHNAFLFDRRVVGVRAVPDNGVQEEVDTGRLIVTNHIRERFPVRNFDSGDVGSVVPASSICPDHELLAAVEAAVADGRDMKEWSAKRAMGPSARPESGELLRGVIFASRASASATASSSSSGQFNAFTHTLDAAELVERAAEFARAAAAANTAGRGGTSGPTSSSLGPLVSGQVVVRFSDEDALTERIDVRLSFAYLPSKATKDEEGEETTGDGSKTKSLCTATTELMREWIMSNLSKVELAQAVTVTVSSGLCEDDISETASNRNKIPLLRDLRGDSISGKGGLATTAHLRDARASKPSATVDDGNPRHQALPAQAPGTSDCSIENSTNDGLHPSSAWIGAYQASPAPLWALPASAARSAQADLECALRRVVPAKLLERVPTATWAPYPLAVSLPLYDSIIALCSSLRKSVKALLSPAGLAVLHEYYRDGGIAGGLGVPSDVVPLLFAGEDDTKDLHQIPIPTQFAQDRVVSDMSRMSTVSSIDQGWSRTLLERERSDFSAASSFRVFEEKEGEGPVSLSHLGIPQDGGYFSANGQEQKVNVFGADGIDTSDLIFWRPDFLFDAAKANRCKECGKAGDHCIDEHGTVKCSWPPSGADTRTRMSPQQRTTRDSPPVSICEINARFTMNAFALSTFGVDAASRMLRRGGQNKDGGSSFSGWSELNLAPVHRLAVMKEEIKKRIGTPGACSIWLVKGREKGYDCHVMENLLGVSSVQDVLPSDLATLLNEWFICAEPRMSTSPGVGKSCSRPDCPNEQVCIPIDAVECESACPAHMGGATCTLLIFLELHQDEILSLPASTLSYLTGSVTAMRKCCCHSPVKIITCNPLSALFLLHDKRTLAVLSNREVMEVLVGARTAEMLADAIICTVPLSQSVRAAAWAADPAVKAAVRDVLNTRKDTMNTNPFQSSSMPLEWMTRELCDAVNNPSQFVLKQSRSGKGVGMMYGQDVTRQTWLTTLFCSQPGSYVLQHKVEQVTFPCILSAGNSSTGSQQTACNGKTDTDLCTPQVCHVVGCIPFLADASFGPGIFRAAPAGPHPVSVTGGGAILVPALSMAAVPFIQQAPRWVIQSVSSFAYLFAEKYNEHDIVTKLRQQTTTWSNCGDCALRCMAQTLDGNGASTEHMESLFALLFYSGVSVLAYCPPKIIAQELYTTKLSSNHETPWIMVCIPPSVRELGDAKRILKHFGVCSWKVGCDAPPECSVDIQDAMIDDSSDLNKFLLQCVEDLGGTPASHHVSPAQPNSSSSMYVWDIAPSFKSAARSHNGQAFPMHTDASFESSPPTHFLLYILSQDTLGGGLSQVLSGETLLRVLSPDMISVLSRPNFAFEIPNEFSGGTGPANRTQSILMTPSLRWRFRADIVRGPDTPFAIHHLESLLRNPSLSVRMRFVPGTAIIVDNGLFFHARSEIFDSTRWLKRIRFHLPEQAT